MSARRKPKVIVRGTAKEIAERAPGYSGNGASEFSREAAQGVRPRMTVNDSPRNEPKPHVYLLQHQLIAKNDRELSHIQKRLLVETDPERRKKLQRDLEIKSRFLSRLYAQQMKGNRRAVRGPETKA